MTEFSMEISGVKKEEDKEYIKKKLKNYVLDATNIDWRQFFIGKNGGKTVAFGRIIDHEQYFETASLGVDYYHRGKGFGSRMIMFLIEEAKRRDPQKPIYGVTHKPEFFKKVGFQETDIYPDYFNYKKNNICKHPSRIKVMQYKEGTATISV